MAWNRPSTEDRQQKKPSAKAPSMYRGIIAGVVVVALGALCFFLFFGGDDASTAKAERKSGRIKEVKPAAAPTNGVEQSEMPKKDKPVVWSTTVKNAIIGEDGRPHFVPPPGSVVVTNRSNAPKQYYEIFKQGYQNELASYMTAPPGTMFVGGRNYSEKFVKKVVETMSLPIEDDPNDTPQQKELRQSMREVMKELQREVDAGRDVREIFREAREEMRDLGLYKMQLKQELRKITKDKTATDADIEDAVSAANIMLEQRGIAPLKLGSFTRQVIKNSPLTDSQGQQPVATQESTSKESTK